MIGAGISGLTCAFLLQKRGIPVVLLEQGDRIGGVIQTLRQDGFLFELGPQSFLGTAALHKLCEDLGLCEELIEANPRAPRFVLAGGRLQPLPMSPAALLRTQMLSTRAKFRLLTEPFRTTRPPDADESVASFVRRKFGEELLENFVAPFVSGIYAGDPERLSLRSAFPSVFEWEKQFGSILRGAIRSRPAKKAARPALSTFRKGLGTLTDALAARLGNQIVTAAHISYLARARRGSKDVYEIHVTLGTRADVLMVDAVVVAIPTPSAATLLSGMAAGLRQILSRISYAPVAVVGMGFRQEQMSRPINGFGFLVTPKEHRQILGTVWNSSLFRGHAPKGMVSMTTFAGGATNPEICTMSDSRIGEIVGREIAELLGITGAPVTQMVWRHEGVLPQYNLGHGDVVAALETESHSLPGLFLTGNYLRGPSIGACLEEADRTAQAVAGYLEAIDRG